MPLIYVSARDGGDGDSERKRRKKKKKSCKKSGDGEEEEEECERTNADLKVVKGKWAKLSFDS